MATISSAGIGSGLDVNSIVTQLMAVERQPLTALLAKASSLDNRISAFGSLKSKLSALSDAVEKLSLETTWSAKTVSSSNSAAVSVSVSEARSASTTSFSVEVSQLARAQSVASASFAPGAGIGSGTLSIELGSWSSSGSPAFSAGSADAVSIAVGSSDTLAQVAAKINSAGAGVTATVLRDATGERLLVRSGATGETSGFRIQATDDGTATSGAGLPSLAFDDPASGVGMAANPVQYARNANATINGVLVTSTNNVLSGTVPGFSMTLAQLTTAPIEITSTTDTVSMRGAIDGFVSAYNALNQTLNAATRYDPSTRTAALLQGDSTTTGLQATIRNLVGAISGGGALQRLSDLGISIAKDRAGDLAVNVAKLDSALQSRDEVRQFFASNAAGSDSTTGFATRFTAFAKAAVGSDGVLATKTTSLQSRRTSIGKEQDRLNDRLTFTEQRLRKQYTSLDTTMSSLTALNNYVSQQVAQWNRSSS